MSVNQFWDMFESELVQSINAAPFEYGLLAGETPEAYSQRVRAKMQATSENLSIRHINLNSPTFRRLAQRINVAPFSQRRLIDAYKDMGGK